MKQKPKNIFLLFWGILVILGSILELVHPSSSIKFLDSQILLCLALLVGIGSILSFILINRNQKAGRTIAMIVLAISILYYVLAPILLFVFASRINFSIIFAASVAMILILWLIWYLRSIIRAA